MTQPMQMTSVKQKTLRVESTHSCAGFTLLELLVVVAILVAVAGIGTFAFRDVQQEKTVDIARAEMQQISKAILQFKADTGYFPGEGPFQLLEDAGGSISLDCTADAPTSVGGIDSNSPLVGSVAEYLSPINFLLLMSNPVNYFCVDDHPLGSMFQEGAYKNTGRGWNGPYIVSAEGVVAVDNSPDRTDGSGALTTGDYTDDVVASLADPFERGDNHPFKFEWFSKVPVNAGEAEEFKAHSTGTPYMLFVSDLDGGRQGVARLVSAGRDGEYDAVTIAAILPTMDEWCAPVDLGVDLISDDLVLCF